jgi:hypothetical protein
LPPEYHGDPLSVAGVLSYYVFGWSLLDDMREAGFSAPRVAIYLSRVFCYFGGLQSSIIATA